MRKLYDDLGEYIPGFFKMSISKEIFDGISWGDFTKEEIATLIHEYVHFLQDISTTRGISNFVYVSKILQLNFYYANTCSETVELPIDIEKIAGEEAYKESELQSFYCGYNGHIKIHHVNKICREKEEIISEIINNSLYAINIYYDDKELPYIFGSDSIAESMAYLVECEKFGAVRRKNEFPYNLCEIVCKEVFPEILQNKSVLVAICELALMHYHSGDMFWNIITMMKNNNFHFKTVHEFENYFLEKTDFLYQDYCEDIREALGCIDFLYTKSVGVFVSINNTLKSFLAKGQSERASKGLFISRLLESCNPVGVVNAWMNYFGMPLICDKNFDVYASNDMSLILTPIAIYNFFGCKTSSRCDMEPFCKKQCIKNFDYKICRNSPWEQVKNVKLCPFGIYWHLYSLEGKNVCRK